VTSPGGLPTPPRAGGALLGIAFVAFVSLGLPDGVLGVAWPTMRRSLDLPLGALGALLAAAMAGYLGASASSGAAVARLGVGSVLAWSSAAMVVSSLAQAIAPAWPVVVAAALVAGLGAGAVDAGINAYAAARFPPRLVSWLHACYGVGAMLGPLVMTAALGAGVTWRGGYGAIGLVLAVMTVAFFLTRDRWLMGVPPSGRHDGQALPDAARGVGASRPGPVATLRRPPVWMNLALFFVYTGLEATAGQWTYSLYTEARGVPPGVAGLWAATFWGSLTVGRVVAGALADRVHVDVLLRLATACAPLGALMVWSRWSTDVSLAGLAVLGFALAPIYPLLVSLTPARIGAAGAPHAIGFQVAAASLGVAALPGVAGILARAHGLEILGPFLVAAAVTLLLLQEVARRATPGAAPAPAAQERGRA
jgi:fucose permease